VTVRVKFVFNEDMIKRFAEASRFSGQTPNRKTTVMLLAALASLVLLGILVYYTSAVDFKWFAELIRFFLSTMFVVFLTIGIVVLIAIIAPNFAAKTYSKAIGSTYEYVFNEYGFSNSMKSQLSDSQTTAYYGLLDRVIETNDSFYLFFHQAQAFIVEKSGVYEGSIQELQHYLKQGVPPDKYTVR